jgi:hypothetical protein
VIPCDDGDQSRLRELVLGHLRAQRGKLYTKKVEHGTVCSLAFVLQSLESSGVSADFVLDVAKYTPRMLSMAPCAALRFFCKAWNQAGFDHIARTSHDLAPGS